MVSANVPFTYSTGSLAQRNLLNRVSYTLSLPNPSDPSNQVRSIYSYDMNGNVEWMATIIDNLPPAFVHYDYDLVSGSVTKVVVNENYTDAWYHKYVYNTDKKLKDVFTSKNGMLWEHDAAYKYFKHGPLKNVILGQDNLQKVDYAYTIQGWLKGMNHLSLANSQSYADLPDLFAMKLHYFTGDFERPGSSLFSTDAYGFGYGMSTPDYNLYNGNIPSIVTSIKNPSDESVNYYAHVYQYDELNRLTKSKYFPGDMTQPSINASYGVNMEDFTYDPNGNILNLNRYNSDPTQLDALTYTYNLDANGHLINNKLNHVTDGVYAVNFPAPDDYDIKPGQTTNNYVYDAIGNLIQDKQEHLQITWNNFGKVFKIEKLNNTNTQVLSTTSYFYDAAGNRVKKSDQATGSSFPDKQEYYIRDASGNPLTQYVRNNTSATAGTLTTTEQTIYGSDRLGVHVSGVVLNTSNGVFTKVTSTPTDNLYRILNNKRYELKDHLGNVRSIFTDLRLATISGTQNNGYAFTDSHAEATAMYNYYAFGSPKPNIYDIDANNNVTTIAYTENYDSEKPTTAMSGAFKYRFGFNGQEKDNEIKGTGNSLNYKARIQDTRLGRFLSVDPLTKSYPWYSPYQFAGNTPIVAIDMDGLEEYVVHNFRNHFGYITKIRVLRVFDKKGNIANQKIKIGADDLSTRKVLIYDHTDGGSTTWTQSDNLTRIQEKVLSKDPNMTQEATETNHPVMANGTKVEKGGKLVNNESEITNGSFQQGIDPNTPNATRENKVANDMNSGLSPGNASNSIIDEYRYQGADKERVKDKIDPKLNDNTKEKEIPSSPDSKTKMDGVETIQYETKR